MMLPSLRPVRTLRIASPQYPRALLPAQALGVQWLQTPSPRSTADVSGSKYRVDVCKNRQWNVSKMHNMVTQKLVGKM